MSDTFYQGLALILPLIFAIVFHEVAHGWVARLLGDPTADEMNRLTLNPLRHVDIIGTVVLPGILALMKWPVFGWAKPVPVNKYRLRNPRRDMMLVAAAGPATNFVMAAVGAVLLGLIARSITDAPLAGSLLQFAILSCTFFIQINVFLALFNLLPIPPFDGSHIVEGLLPFGAAKVYGRIRPYGFTLILVLLVVLPLLVPGFDIVSCFMDPPFGWVMQHYQTLAEAVAKI